MLIPSCYSEDFESALREEPGNASVKAELETLKQHEESQHRAEAPVSKAPLKGPVLGKVRFDYPSGILLSSC